VKVLNRLGFANVLVEAGGDLLASGKKSPDLPWQIGIQSPRKEKVGLLGNFNVENRAVAAFGDYMQPFTADMKQHHILDPRTGYSAPELASVTVIAPSAALADGLTTTIMNLGPQAGLGVIENLTGCEACLISKDLQIVNSSGFRDSSLL
jgi:thiamine biosynthesis lipoprotein